MNQHPNREVALFGAALELAGSQRAAFLDQACADDPALRLRLEELLRVHDQARPFLETPASAPQASPPPEEVPETTARLSGSLAEKEGDRIGRYKLLQQIGEGGCGLVYMAEQEEPVRRRVALKVIKLGMDTKQVIARFEAERQALALMDHPNIAKVLDAGATDTGRPYFVMELVRGIKITEYCDEHNLSTNKRLDLFIQVCHAVQHAHQKGIIHRDLKPSNILVASNDGVPVPKVIDFGIAKATQGRLTDQTLFTAFEQFIGTPAYMSPEQAELTMQDVDTRTDVYSLGVLLYELLTGKTPFDAQQLLASGLDAMRRTIREQEPERPSTKLSTMMEGELSTTAKHRHTDAPRLVHLIRGDLDWIVMKALEKDRARRYETANGLANDVRRHLNCEPVAARPPSKLYEFQKTVRRHKFGFAAAAGITLVLAIGLVASTLEAVRANRAELGQSRLRQLAQEAGAKEIRLRQEAQAQELSSRRQAYVSDMGAAFNALNDGNLGVARQLLALHRPRENQEDLRGFEWRYLWGLSRGDQVRVLTGHSNFVECLAYSPDGTMLASGGLDCSVKVWNPRTGQSLATCAGHSRRVISVAFSPDGRLLASGGDDGLVQLWNVGNWRIVATLTNPSPRLAFSGSLLAIASGGDEFGYDGGAVILWDYVKGRGVMTLPESGNRAVFSADGQTLATANWEGTVKLWDVASGRELRSASTPEVVSMAFSADGRRLAWCSDRRTVWLWELENDKPVALEEGTGRKIYGVAFSPDGKILATACATHDILLWDVLRHEKVAKLLGHGHEVRAVVFSPDGKSLASASRDETVMIWNASIQRPKNQIDDIASRPFHSVGLPVFSPDGKLLAAGSQHGILLWEAINCEVAARLPTDCLPASFSSDGRSLLAIDRLSTRIEHWRIPTKTLEQTISLSPITNHEAYYADAFSYKGNLIATAHEDGITLRSTLTGEFLFALTNLAPTRSLAFSPDGRMLGTGHWGGTAELWDMTTRGLLLEVGGFRDAVASFAFSCDGKLFAAASWDSSIRIYDIAGKRELAKLTGHRSAVGFISFSRDGRTLASSGAYQGTKLWNVATGREILMLKFMGGGAGFSFSPDDRTFEIGYDLLRAPTIEEGDAPNPAAEWEQGAAPAPAPAQTAAKPETLAPDTLANARALLTSDPIGAENLFAAFGGALRQQNKYTEAEPPFREALTIARRSVTNDATRLEAALVDLASVLRGQGKFNEAELLLREADAGAHQLSANEQWRLEYWSVEMGYVLRGQHRFAEAEPHLRQALAITRQFPGDPARLDVRLADVGYVLRSQKKDAQAEPFFREALSNAWQFETNDLSRLQARVNDLADVLQRQGKVDALEELFRIVLPASPERQPVYASLLGSRAEFFARRGRWKKAATDAAQLVQLEPTNHWYYHCLATLLVQVDDVDGYRAHCQRAVLQFRGTEDPNIAERMAKDCLILPHSGADLMVLSAWCETALTAGANSSDLPWFQFVKALAEYRLGHFASAAEWTLKVRSAAGNVFERDAAARTVLAMAQWQSKQTEEARASLAKALDIVNTKMPKLESGGLGGGWLDWIIAQALMREAKALIEGQPAASKE
jgi:WD40 repeat protein/tRNA A-37 threonylcarbamoyl transferase component Bud32/tetratricopeptide (TPR) repeat protein